MRALTDQVRLAFMLLTRLPMGRIDRPVPMAAAFWAYPLPGALVGAAVGGALWATQTLGLPVPAGAVLALVLGLALTGALHEDGLADTADSLGARDRARKLEIMRDSRIGSYGVLALILAAGLRVTLWADLPAGPGTVWALAALGALSRAALPVIMLALRPARDDGLGRAAAEGAGWRGAALGGALALAGALLTGGWPLAFAAFAGAAVLAGLARAQIGGFTGDTLGAAQIVAECAGLIALALLAGAGR